MAKYSKIDVLTAMRQTGMVPVFYHADPVTAERVAAACYAGGVRAFEFTNRGEGAHEVFAHLLRFVERECPGMILGAGSVVDAGTASLYIQLGANFIVGPLFNPDVAKVCNRRLVPYTPGCGTVTEIGTAQEAGCDLCKIFPAGEVGGPSFVKNILAPMPWTLIMATGAVEPVRENLRGWMKAGTCCVGMGSKLFPADAIAAGDWGRITAVCRESLEIIAECRREKPCR